MPKKLGWSKNYKPDYSIKGDSLMQLQDERIVSYNFKGYNTLTIYNQNTFENLLSIDLYTLFKKEINECETKKDFENQNSIIELNNNLLLVGYYQLLFEINLKEKSFESKIVYKSKENIFTINLLSDKRIVLITEGNIEILDKVNDEYILKEKNRIKDNWKMHPDSSEEFYYCSNFNQYYFSFELPNNRLMLNSFSTELKRIGHCGTHPPDEYINSKIIFIDLKNFEEIKTTKEFNVDAKSIVLDNLIIIQANKDIYIYDINTLDIIRNIELEDHYNYLSKYNNDYLIAYSDYEESNNLLIYKVEGKDLAKNLEVKNTFGFNQRIGYNFYPIYEYNNKFLFTLKDNRIIILCHEAINILNLKI